MRRLATLGVVLVALAVLALLAAGCGGGRPAGHKAGPTLDQIRLHAGREVGLVAGTSAYAVGSIRVSFLLVRDDGSLVRRPAARLWLARSLHDPAVAQGVARSESILAPGVGSNPYGTRSLYAGSLRVTQPGRYRLLVEPGGGRRVHALAEIEVAARPAWLAAGEQAPASNTPTLSSRRPASSLTTHVPPDRPLLRTSVADALRERAAFVVVFAIPKFCRNRTCGPVVDVVEAVRRRLAGSGVRFIHVEPFTGNDPTRGLNRWAREWRIPSEPFTYLVGSDGKVTGSFEGSFSIEELETAVRRDLLRPRR